MSRPLAAVAATALCAAGLSAQTTTMPSTLRYGSGLIDVPVASVMEDRMISATFSGFWAHLGGRVLVDESGAEAGYGPGIDGFFPDASFAVGFLDRFEAGATLQSFNGGNEGGEIWGLFGRARLWRPADEGLGLAVGGRYLTSPSFGDGRSYRPGRLGFADDRLLASYTAADGVGTNLSLYAVGTLFLRGFDGGGRLPPNDLTFTFGLGSGMFDSPGDLAFYSEGHTNGWFAGTALHVDVSQRSMLTLMAEHNGFDVNLGAQYDWEGFRVGVQWLATNHDWPIDGHVSEYQRPKFGVMGSVTVCLLSGSLRCRPRRLAGVEPDTIYIPPPPPDTVVVTVGEAPGEPEGGEEEALCLSTGQNVPIRVMADGDTLVAPTWISLREARPTFELAGSYAAGAFWYESGERIVFEARDYGRSDDTFPVDCDQIVRVGVHEGVPVFAVLSARRPLSAIFVPVRPGVWRRYERGLEPR